MHYCEQPIWSADVASAVEREVIAPDIARINAVLGEEHDIAWVVHAVEVALGEGEPPAPGHLWEWAEDVCQVCGASIGHRLRFMHLGRCDNCANSATH